MKKNIQLSQKYKSLLCGFIFLFTISSLSAQDGNVWATVDDLIKLESSDVFSDLSEKLNITYKQALSNSKSIRLLKVYEFTCECENADLFTALQKVDELKEIEYGPQYESLALPNDYNTVFDSLWSLDLISAEDAWDWTHGDSSVNVAISDQNYNPNHEELTGKVNYYDASNTSPQTHGTAVAITVAGNTNNGVGLSSIGYDLSLNLYRMNYNDVLAASYAGAQVINLSWTSGCSFSQYIQDVINEVYDNGTFIVAAAGNGFTCGGPSALVYPSACDNVFAVTSIGVDDNHEQVAGDSTSTHQHNATVDLCAPGYDVPISDAPGWYLFGSGTSYAAPFVTGTVGLMLSVNPCLSNLLIEQYLEKSADFIYLLNPDYYGLLGEGRLNSRGAVTLAANSYSNTQPCLEIPTKSADVDALNLKVYPNPSNGIFNITVGGDEIIDRVEIYNNMGQQIISKFNASSFEIDLTQESTGVYFVRAYIYDEVVSSVVSLF